MYRSQVPRHYYDKRSLQLLRARPPQNACDWLVETKSNIGVGVQRDATDACIDGRAFEG